MALETLREQITAERFGSARMVAFINRKLDEVVEDYAAAGQNFPDGGRGNVRPGNTFSYTATRHGVRFWQDVNTIIVEARRI